MPKKLKDTNSKRGTPLGQALIAAAEETLAHLRGEIKLESYTLTVVATPMRRVPRTDPHLSGAGERVREAAADLERLCIANTDGSRIRKDLPTDMQADASRDFGG